MIKLIDGDLLESKCTVIAHQVNCKGVMGSGVAKQIRKKYPEVYVAYNNFCAQNKDSDMLGRVQMVKTKDGRLVANIFGQKSYGSDGKKYTDINALRQCFNILHGHALCNDIRTIAMPYKIGCGLGGGNWEEVLEMIYAIFEDIDVELWRLKYD